MLRTPGPADRTGLRRANLALLVRTLRDHGQISRAQLAVRSGLSKATVSSLVGDLAGVTGAAWSATDRAFSTVV